MEYKVFAENDESVIQYDGPILIERHCSECGDALLGYPGGNSKVHCEEGHCHSRPGASYVGKTVSGDGEFHPVIRLEKTWSAVRVQEKNKFGWMSPKNLYPGEFTPFMLAGSMGVSSRDGKFYIDEQPISLADMRDGVVYLINLEGCYVREEHGYSTNA